MINIVFDQLDKSIVFAVWILCYMQAKWIEKLLKNDRFLEFDLSQTNNDHHRLTEVFLFLGSADQLERVFPDVLESNRRIWRSRRANFETNDQSEGDIPLSTDRLAKEDLFSRVRHRETAVQSDHTAVVVIVVQYAITTPRLLSTVSDGLSINHASEWSQRDDPYRYATRLHPTAVCLDTDAAQSGFLMKFFCRYRRRRWIT